MPARLGRTHRGELDRGGRRVQRRGLRPRQPALRGAARGPAGLVETGPTQRGYAAVMIAENRERLARAFGQVKHQAIVAAKHPNGQRRQGRRWCRWHRRGVSSSGTDAGSFPRPCGSADPSRAAPKAPTDAGPTKSRSSPALYRRSGRSASGRRSTSNSTRTFSRIGSMLDFCSEPRRLPGHRSSGRSTRFNPIHRRAVGAGRPADAPARPALGQRLPAQVHFPPGWPETRRLHAIRLNHRSARQRRDDAMSTTTGRRQRRRFPTTGPPGRSRGWPASQGCKPSSARPRPLNSKRPRLDKSRATACTATCSNTRQMVACLDGSAPMPAEARQSRRWGTKQKRKREGERTKDGTAATRPTGSPSAGRWATQQLTADAGRNPVGGPPPDMLHRSRDARQRAGIDHRGVGRSWAADRKR